MIVIPMAGLSRRFREAGFERPKYMLELHGKTLFAHAVESFAAYFTSEPFLFIAREETGTRRFIETELARLGVQSAQVVTLPRPTLGQADTVRLGLQEAGTDRTVALTIFNIDTFRPGFRYPQSPWFPDADGYLEVMPGSDPGFSFVLPEPGTQDGRVQMTAEKRVISNLASTGLYWFRQAGDFLDAMAQDEAAAQAHGELYIAPLYNALIARRRDVRYQVIGEHQVVFCGIPDQYNALVQAGPASAG